jgi:hypothetical protein
MVTEGVEDESTYFNRFEWLPAALALSSLIRFNAHGLQRPRQ